MSEQQERKGLTLYLDPDVKDEIENYFMDCRIRNFQEGYRNLINLGFQESKKLKKEE